MKSMNDLLLLFPPGIGDVEERGPGALAWIGREADGGHANLRASGTNDDDEDEDADEEEDDDEAAADEELEEEDEDEEEEDEEADEEADESLRPMTSRTPAQGATARAAGERQHAR